MAHWPRWNSKVCSDYNLAAFQQWLPTQDPVEASKYLDLYIIEHSDPPGHPFLSGTSAGKVHHIHPRLCVGGKEILIPRRPCCQPSCDACGVRGGYQFQWMGPWTCHASLQASPATADHARQIWLACDTCRACRIRRGHSDTVFQAQLR